MGFEDTTIFLEPKVDPQDRLEVEIGDAKQEEFHPQIKVKRWDNEYNFSLRLVHDEVDPGIIQEQDAVRWVGEDMETSFYEVSTNEFFPDGAMEFDVTQTEYAPVRFTINMKGLEAFYQPAFTEEELAKGWIRPDHVIGSWAFYTKDAPQNIEDGKEYRCGKFGHWYRGKIYDANGLWAWLTLDLTIDEKTETGEMEVSCQDQEFLKNAVGPFRHAAGATFGYTTAGASFYQANGNGYLDLWDKYTTGGTGYPVQTYHAYFWSARPSASRMALYDATPSSRIDYSNEAGGGTGWQTWTSAQNTSLSASTQYFIAMLANGPMYIQGDTGSTKTQYFKNVGYGVPPDPVSSPSSFGNNQQMSLYVTYAPAPSITPSTGSLSDFGSVGVGSNSSESSFTFTGSDMTADAVISAPDTNFQVSLTSGSGFGSSVNVSPSSGSISTTTIYVRFTPQSSGAKSGNVTLATTGGTTQNVAVSGTGIVLNNAKFLSFIM